jgi:excisionase family DNA binding protein
MSTSKEAMSARLRALVSAPPELLDTELAADYLGIKRHTLEVWRVTGRYNLSFVRVGRRVKYRRTDLDRFLAERTVGFFDGTA